MILWLTAYGARKRMHGLGRWTLHEWLSAHVWLGLSVVVIGTLHTGFQLAANVHGLAWVLMVLTVVSGIVGTVAYVRLPMEVTRNARGETQVEMIRGVAELDVDLRMAAEPLTDAINQAVIRATGASRVGGGLWRQLSGRDPSCATAAAIREVPALATDLPPTEARAARRVLHLLGRKQGRLMQARRDVRMRAWLQIWLYLHVPLASALLAAVAAHVVVVAFFW